MLNQTQAATPYTGKTWNIIIWALSIAIPVVVAVLLFVPQTGKLGDIDVSILPHINAVLNSATAISLVVGFYFIKQKNIKAHRASMLSALLLSSLFLVSYVLYHFQAPSTYFGDVNGDKILSEAEKAAVGGLRYFYLVLLLTHILLATTIVPMALFSIFYGLTNQIEKHKKVSKFTFPVWLYVAVSGVIVYLMISPYYSNNL